MEILKKLNIDYKNIELYEQAFTHSSYKNEARLLHDYERLEFLGDKVIDLVISDYLFVNNNINEGEMTKLRAKYVCEKAHYEYANFLGLNNYIKLGKGEADSGGMHKKAIVADVFEAFIGAMYIDKGYLYAYDFIHKNIIPFINSNDDFFKDYKSVLQEYIQPMQKDLAYELIDEQGPAHNKEFSVHVLINGIPFGVGVAGSKKEAEQQAAKDALSKKAKIENDL